MTTETQPVTKNRTSERVRIVDMSIPLGSAMQLVAVFWMANLVVMACLGVLGVMGMLAFAVMGVAVSRAEPSQ